ncbi:hypothetical protein ABBQ38_008549 [Trebouxia sp. C0009 RCD-2024]
MPFPLSSRSFVYANCSQVGRNLKIKHWVTWKDAGRGSNSKRDKSQSRAQQCDSRYQLDYILVDCAPNYGMLNKVCVMNCD